MSRDTSEDWKVIGEHQPYFGVLSQEKYLRDRLDPEALTEFYESGRADVDAILENLRALGVSDFKPSLALDFGCGVGRLTLPMAQHATRVIGVDVSDHMLAEAREQAAARGVPNVEFRQDLPRDDVDWINSLIVFQHIAPARGLELLASMLGTLRLGGVVSLQLTFFRDFRHKGEIDRDLADYRYDGETVTLLSTRDTPTGAMSMYDYDLNKVFRLLFLHGVSTTRVLHTDHAGCHGVHVFGLKMAESAPTDT